MLRLIDGAASYFMSGTGHIMGVHIETDMRRDAFDHLLRLDHTYYNNTKGGQIMGRITNDLFDVTEFAHHCPEEFFIAFIKIVASFLISARPAFPLTLVVFACVPLMGVVSVYLNLKLRARFGSSASRLVSSTPPSRTACWGSGWSRPLPPRPRSGKSLPRATEPLRTSRPLPTTPWPPSTLHTSVRRSDVSGRHSGWRPGAGYTGPSTPGDLVAYVLYVSTLIATIRRIVEFAEQFQRGMTGIERFLEIMDTPVAIADAPDARAADRAGGRHSNSGM